jgi:hypothetical protein
MFILLKYLQYFATSDICGKMERSSLLLYPSTVAIVVVVVDGEVGAGGGELQWRF